MNETTILTESRSAAPIDQECDQMHSFSRNLAEKYGVHEAILLGFLAHKVQRSRHEHDGRRWYYDTLDA